MLNLVDRRFDFASVLFAVLGECEHRRRSLADEDEQTQEARLAEIARTKLDEIAAAYREGGGSLAYWQAVQQEVLATAMPQYAPSAARQTALEVSGYGTWRQGDVLARAVFALVGLTVGGIVVALPFIPIYEDAFAFLLALSGFLYPELRKLMFDRRHARLMNRLLAEAARYQATQLRYLTDASLEEAIGAAPESTTTTAPARAAQPVAQAKTIGTR